MAAAGGGAEGGAEMGWVEQVELVLLALFSPSEERPESSSNSGD